MIAYFDQLNDTEKAELTAVIEMLFHQTYILEKKYDRRLNRYQANAPYRACERHLDFLKDYFAVAGLSLSENRQLGIMALKGGKRQGDRIGKLPTLFVLILKLLYDEKMNTVSNTIHAYTTLSEIYGKIQLFRLWENRALPITEVRRALALVKRYQLAEVFDTADDLHEGTRILIYPTVNEVVNAMDLVEFLERCRREEADDADGAGDADKAGDADGTADTDGAADTEEEGGSGWNVFRH